jgi:hypothetical protein
MKPSDRLDHLRVASPCPTSWNQMAGDDRVRFCDLCNLHVYNIARLSRKEAEALISNTEGRICARLYRRSDGTILTKDCPVGLRAIRRSIARVAGAVFATIMSLVSTASGQKQPAKDQSSRGQQVTVTRSQHDPGSIYGTLIDQNGATVSGARIKLTFKADGTTTLSDTGDDATFQIHGLKGGIYELSIECPGFDKIKNIEITLAADEAVTVKAILRFDATTETVGVLMGNDEPISSPMTILTGDVIRRLPLHRN